MAAQLYTVGFNMGIGLWELSKRERLPKLGSTPSVSTKIARDGLRGKTTSLMAYEASFKCVLEKKKTGFLKSVE